MLEIDCVRRAVSRLMRYFWASSRTTTQVRMILSEYNRKDVPTILPFTDCHCINKPRTMSNKTPAVRPEYERNNEVLNSAWWYCAHRRGRDPWGPPVVAFQDWISCVSSLVRRNTSRRSIQSLIIAFCVSFSFSALIWRLIGMTRKTYSGHQSTGTSWVRRRKNKQLELETMIMIRSCLASPLFTYIPVTLGKFLH